MDNLEFEERLAAIEAELQQEEIASAIVVAINFNRWRRVQDIAFEWEAIDLVQSNELLINEIEKKLK